MLLLIKAVGSSAFPTFRTQRGCTASCRNVNYPLLKRAAHTPIIIRCALLRRACACTCACVCVCVRTHVCVRESVWLAGCVSLHALFCVHPWDVLYVHVFIYINR